MPVLTTWEHTEGEGYDQSAGKIGKGPTGERIPRWNGFGAKACSDPCQNRSRHLCIRSISQSGVDRSEKSPFAS
jgi:hypothetical protein